MSKAVLVVAEGRAAVSFCREEFISSLAAVKQHRDSVGAAGLPQVGAQQCEPCREVSCVQRRGGHTSHVPPAAQLSPMAQSARALLEPVAKQPLPAPTACSAALGTWIYIENTMSCSCCFIRKNLESVKYNSLG